MFAGLEGLVCAEAKCPGPPPLRPSSELKELIQARHKLASLVDKLATSAPGVFSLENLKMVAQVVGGEGG